MRYFEVFPFSTAHVEEVRDPARFVTSSADFYLDYSIDHVLMGRYGICGVREEFAQKMDASRLTGYSWAPARALRWKHAEQRGEISLPEIRLLVVGGRFMEDDFFRNSRNDLFVSESVQEFLALEDPVVARFSQELDPGGKPIRKYPGKR
ncbi:hypothetical protein SAMN04488550_4486 [Gordonia malaquae]|uniref:Uncharacterized protein n=1 Tax=Gordonia malaquae NBRC 108250 TaxID=1223542 RepID=M3VHK5_GORML|nr:hypothetical protein [Gordonia malaquae]GAC82134.1 hypothetical protein GM1_104_00010 [Gordonia malaquae NBRC 108250]SEE40667.1 hypothetical protein SAMN04488550_4486 [Gordonia malaquae]